MPMDIDHARQASNVTEIAMKEAGPAKVRVETAWAAAAPVHKILTSQIQPKDDISGMIVAAISGPKAPSCL